MALMYGSQVNRLREDLFYIVRQGRKTHATLPADPEYQLSWKYAVWASFKLEVSVATLACAKNIF